MILAVEAITHVAQADSTGHILQFAVAIGRAGEAIERVVGDVQLHDVAPQLREGGRLRADRHAFLDRRRAGGGIAFAAFDFDEAHPA